MPRNKLRVDEPRDISNIEARIWLKHLLSSPAATEDYVADLRERITLYTSDKDRAIEGGDFAKAQMAIAQQRAIEHELNIILRLVNVIT